MKIKAFIVQHWVPIVVFILTTSGLLALLPRSTTNADALLEVPTLVVTSDLPAGSDANTVRAHVDIRLMPISTRATGALESIDDIPSGLLNSRHVIGQQLLESSFDKSQVLALGDNYVSVSIRMDPQRWTGPFTTSGQRVDIYRVRGDTSELISSDAVIINAPSTDVKPEENSVVTFGIQRSSVSAVLIAAKNEEIWVTSR